MEKGMETTMVYWGYIGIMGLGFRIYRTPVEAEASIYSD